MTKRDSTSPRIDAVVLPPLEDGVPGSLRTDARVDRLRFDGVDASGTDLAGAVIEECLLHAVRLDDAVLDGARIVDSVLDGVTSTHLRGSRLAQLDRVELVGCRIDYLALTDARLQDVRFTDCTIGDLDLRGATVRRTAFAGSTVRELSVHDARIEQLDLRGVELDRVDGTKHLAGATISADQLPRFAPLLAEALGIRVG